MELALHGKRGWHRRHRGIGGATTMLLREMVRARSSPIAFLLSPLAAAITGSEFTTDDGTLPVT